MLRANTLNTDLLEIEGFYILFSNKEPMAYSINFPPLKAGSWTQHTHTWHPGFGHGICCSRQPQNKPTWRTWRNRGGWWRKRMKMYPETDRLLRKPANRCPPSVTRVTCCIGSSSWSLCASWDSVSGETSWPGPYCFFDTNSLIYLVINGTISLGKIGI